MPLTHAERGRRGAASLNSQLTPEQRRANAQLGHLTQAVETTIRRAPELSEDQLSRLRAVFAATPDGRDAA